jgi:anti-sigma factor RsiW
MMTSLLHQLENNEAILLMYLADELPAEDRADVEQQLASDPALRTELEELRGVQESFAGTMGRLDAETRLPVSESVAVRRATRMLRQWQVDHVNGAAAEEEPVKELRFPWWSYPLTTAAAVLIAFLVWWGNRGERYERPSPNYPMEYASGPVDFYRWIGEIVACELQWSL